MRPEDAMLELEDVAACSSEELHELLAGGDARERLLAVWALALRSAAVTTMATQLRHEPDPGVRRALAVVLAGEGELDLLVAMSRHDPNVHVRASASQILVRFAAADRIPWSLVTARLADAPEVRAAVISQLGPTSPPELRTAVLAGLCDDSDLVRREAFEVALRLVRAGLADTSVLADTLERAGRGEVAHLVEMWLAAETPERLAAALTGARGDIRERILLRYPDLAHTTLAPLIGDDADLYLRLRRQLGLRLDKAPLAILLRLAARPSPEFEVLYFLAASLEKLDRLPAELLPLARAIGPVDIAPSGALARVDPDETDADDDDERLEREGILAALRTELARLS